MSFFLILILFLFFSACLEIVFAAKKKLGIFLFVIDLVVIALALSFRYSEGSDYLNYYQIFLKVTEIPTFTEFAQTWYGGSSPLFFFLTWLLARAGLPFEGYIVLLALIGVMLMGAFLFRYAEGFRCLSLTAMFPTYIFMYQFSALREGLVIAVFLGVLLPLMEHKKWVWYYVIVGCSIFLHGAALLYLLCPFVVRMRTRVVEVLTGGFLLGGVLINVGLYLSRHSFTLNIFALCLRLLLLLGIMLIYHKGKYDEFETVLYRLFVIGMGGYFLISFNPFYASRCSDAIRFVDVLILVAFMRQLHKKLVFIISILVFLYAGALLCKNLESRSNSGMIESIHAWNYPYITIFDKDRVYEYLPRHNDN